MRKKYFFCWYDERKTYDRFCWVLSGGWYIFLIGNANWSSDVNNIHTLFIRIFFAYIWSILRWTDRKKGTPLLFICILQGRSCGDDARGSLPSRKLTEILANSSKLRTMTAEMDENWSEKGGFTWFNYSHYRPPCHIDSDFAARSHSPQSFILDATLQGPFTLRGTTRREFLAFDTKYQVENFFDNKWSNHQFSFLLLSKHVFQLFFWKWREKEIFHWGKNWKCQKLKLFCFLKFSQKSFDCISFLYSYVE